MYEHYIIVVAVQYGRQSLELVLKSILGTEKSLVSSEDYPQDFFDGMWETKL